MQVEERSIFSRIDGNLVFVIMALNIIGLINLYSATHGVNLDRSTNLFWQQMVWIVIGWGIFLTVTLIDYTFLKRIAYVIYGLNLAALVAVDLVGVVSLGAQRWLDLGFFRYQPSETMKLALVLVLARSLHDIDLKDGLGFKQLVGPALLALVPAGLTIIQPDLGTGLLLVSIFVGMIFFAGVHRSVMIFFFVAGLIALPMAWSFGLKAYQKQRVLTFLNPGNDARGAGYNSIQSKVAVGSGMIIGKGFRKGTQSQLEFLPERHTDFIFSVLSEEHGFIGSVTTAGLLMTLLFMGARIASQAKDRFGTFIAVGALCLIFFHITVNILMVMGLLPIVGVPLPLLSYGGSIMITTMASLGIVSAVAYRKFLF
jgi:rod shape determining protein RodA